MPACGCSLPKRAKVWKVEQLGSYSKNPGAIKTFGNSSLKSMHHSGLSRSCRYSTRCEQRRFAQRTGFHTEELNYNAIVKALKA
ncbi:hypothetical protein OK016_06140 [Vibrio chagasii]|nr:hypothetical protein [Vibrio chagasii]